MPNLPATTSSVKLPRVEAKLEAFLETVRHDAAALGAGALSFREAEERLAEALAKVGCVALDEELRALDPDEELVVHEGDVYKRMKHASRGDYMSLYGHVNVPRPLYRQTGVRNGPTLDPIAVRAGMVDGRTTPTAAGAIGYLMQSVPAHEARRAAKACRVLPFGQSTFQRVANSLGAAWEAHRLEGEERLMEDLEVPEEAMSVSIAADRVSLRLLEEENGEPTVNYRMAYVGCLTLHDGDGAPLETVRYGRLPSTGHIDLVSSLTRDLDAVLEQRPDLRIVTLADGAHEMQELLDKVVAGRTVEGQLVDFWHFLEKIGDALVSIDHRVPDQMESFTEDLLQRDGAVENIERWLRWYQRTQPTDPIHRALTYIENHRDRLRYATVRSRGLPIGSGQVEASCKSLVTVRMKRGGARWGSTGGQAILNLRSLALSNRWEPALAYTLDTFVRQVRAAA